jgi:hypothetical protein
VLRPILGTLVFALLWGKCATAKTIPFPVKHGSRFELDMENAGEIKLIGSWNGWDAAAHTLHRWGSYYWLDVDLERGRYEYFFKNTQGRFLPPNTLETIDDGFGGVNAVAVIE